MSLHPCLRRGLIAAAVLALSACESLSTKQPMPLLDYQPEAFGANAFSHHFAARPARTCEAARRALLSQGYVVTSATAPQVTARKYFQPDAVHHVQLEFRVVCAPEAGDSAASVAFVSGLKEQYVMRKAKDSASVGVGGIGSLSLPIEGGLDALVKVSSETVVDDQLYARFFALVGEHLDAAVEPPSAPEASPAPPPPPPPPPPPVFVLVPQPAPLPPAAASALQASSAALAAAAHAPEQPASAVEPAAAPAMPPVSAPQPAASAAVTGTEVILNK